MAFFGLTALGPQNNFRASLLGQPTLHLFSEEEVRDAFNDVVGVKQKLCKECRGDPPKHEVQRMRAELVNAGEHVTWKDVKDAFRRLREESEKRWLEPVPLPSDSSASHRHSSYSEYRDANHRHIRSKRGPREFLGDAITSNQQYGWEVQDQDNRPVHKIYGKKSCPETLYAAALVKSGIAG